MDVGGADWLLVTSAGDLDFVVIVVGFFLLDCKKIVLQIDMVPSNYIVRNRLSITIDSKLNIK